MALNLLNDDELELLDSKGVEALSDDALERLDAEDAPAPSIPSPIAATADGLQRLNQGITDAAVAAAKPVAAPIDAAIKRVDERSALAMPHIPTTQKTAEGDVHGDLFPDLITAAAGKVTGQLVDKALGDTPELVKRGVKDVTAGAVQLGSGVGGVMRAMGFENIGQMIAKSAQQTAKELMPPDPNIVDQIAQGLGSMAAFMVPGLGISGSASAVATVAPRLAMFLGTATSTVLEAGTEAGDVYNKVMEKTGDKNEANVAAGRAFFANLPLIHYTNKLGWAGEQSGRLARALESFFTEGFQEGGQEFISNLAAHDPLMKGVVEAAFVGGIVGAGAGAVAHGPVTAIQHPEGQPPAPPAAPAAPPAAPAAAAPEMVGPGTGKPVHLVTEAEREGGAPAPAAPAPAPIPTPEEIKAKPEPVKPEAPKKKGKKGKKAKAEVVESDAEDGVEPGAEPQEGPEETVDPEDPLAKLKAEAMAENKALAEKERPIGSEITWKEAKGKKGKGTVVGHSWRADGFTLKVRVGGTEKTLENGKKIVEGGKLIYLGAEEDIGVKMGEKAKLYKEAEAKQENDRQAAYEAKRDADEKVVAEKLTVLKELHAKAMAAPKAERAAIAEEYAKKLEDYEAAIEGAGYNRRSDVRAREKVGFIEPPPTALLYRETSSEEMDKSPEFKAAVKEAVESSSTRSEFREKLAEIVLNKDIPVNRTLLGVLADTKAGKALGIEGRDIHGMDTLGGSPFSGQKQADEMSRIAAPMLEKMKAVKPSKEKTELLKKFAAKLDSILPDTPRKGKKAKGSDDITAATRAQLVEAARMGEISDDVIRSITESGKVTSDGSTGLRGHIQLSTKEMDIDIHEGFFDKEIKVAKSNTELMAKAAALDLKQKGLPPSVNEESRARLVQWVRESTVGWRGSDEYIDDVRFVIDNFTAPAEALVKAMRGWKDSGRHPADQIVLMRGEGIIKELGWPTRDAALYYHKQSGELENFAYLMRKEPDYAGHREVSREERTRDLVDYYDPVTDGSEIIKQAEEQVEEMKAQAKTAKGKQNIAIAENGVKAAQKSLKEVKEKLGKPGALTPDAPKIEYAPEDIPEEAPADPVDNIVDQLEKAGYDTKTARTLGVVFEGFRVLGDRAGIAAHKLFDRYGVRIVKGEGEGGTVLEQGKTLFKKWFGKSKVVDAKGKPLVVYHGTTGEFTTFAKERANRESDFGAGFYFTNTQEDVAANYAGEGPDLQNKIERRAERLESEAGGIDAPYSSDEAKEQRQKFYDQARSELSQHGGATMPVYLKMEKPFVVGGPKETFLEMEFEEDENGDIIGEKGPMADFVEALRYEASNYSDGEVEDLLGKLLEHSDGIGASQLYELASNDERFSYFTDENGKLVSKEILRAALERAGFDGIIDHAVDIKFGSQKRIGKPMEGMNEETIHYIAFNPGQVKSAIGNSGKFSASESILEQSGARGRIRISLDRQFSIELLEGADLSTFLHEAGHLYLEVLGDIAADPAASEQVKGDYDTILSWLGVKSREEIGGVHHEKFARGFESYLMEGKAPTQRLRAAFDTFKSWLGAIYKQLSALDVELTPEVRRVFDRMMASDAEIAVELQAAEKALADARKRKNEADSQAPPEVPQDALPAAKAAVAEETVKVKKAKEKVKPVAKQKGEKVADGARIESVKRSVLEAFSETPAMAALVDPEAAKKPFTFLKPAQLEKFVNAGLLDSDFVPTPLAHKAMAELARLKELMKKGYLEDISISEPKKITLKSFLKGIVHDSRFALLATYDMGWFTDGKIAFRTMKGDEAAYAPYKHLTKGHNAPNLEQVLKGTEPANDQVVGVLGVHEGDRVPALLIQTEGGRQLVVAAQYYNFFKERYPDAKLYAQGERLPIKVELGGQMVGALMPMDMKTGGKYTVFAVDGTPRTVEMSKGRIEVDAKMAEITTARGKLDFAKRVHAENLKEIRQLDETPGEKTAALITKIAQIQQENLDLENQMAETGKSIASLEEQVAALREQHGITDIPASGLVKKSRPKGGKGGGKGASSGDFAFDTPVEMGGMEHIKPFRMPELVRLAYELMGKVPEIGGLSKYHGYFKGVGGGEIKLNPLIFLKPEQAAKTLAHEIGHLIDYLPDHTLKRGNLLGSLKSLHAHLANTFGTLQVTNKDLRDELMAVTDYWRPWDKEASADSYRAYRKSARELYADAISMLFNSPGTLERMAPKFYKGFFEALDAKPAVKLSFFQLQALLNSSEMNIQEARHLDRKAMYLKAEDLWTLKRKEQEARESHYAEWFKQLVVEKHQKAIGMAEAEASKGQPLPPSQDPRYILEELSLADNANHAFLEEIDAKVVKPMTDSEVTLLDLGDYLYLSRVAQGDRQAFANPKDYNPDEAGKAIDYMRTRLGAERFGKLEAAAAAFREVVYKLSEEAVAVGAYSQQVFDEKIKPNRGSYAVFAVQDFLEDYIAAGVKEQIGTLKDIANPFTATVMKMVALNRLIAKQKGANVMRDFLLQRGEAEKAEALNPQDNLVQFRQRKGRGLLELLENGKRAAYYVDPYIAEAFKKKEAGTFHLAVKILDSVFNGVFRPLYITFNIGFQLYSNPIRDFGRTRRNVYALVKNEGYAGTVKSLMMAYFDSLSPAAKRAMDIPDALVSEMIANKSLDITFTDFSFDPDADQYTAVLRKMGVAPPQQNGLMDKLSKTKVLYPLVRLLEGIRFIGNAHETASKIAGYKVLKSDMLKTLDAAIRDEKDPATKARYQSERQKLEKGEGEFAHELAYNTRNYVGTPNWRRRGTISHITNTLFPFSNIMVQGMRSDLEVATRPATRTGFMFDMVLTQVLPKMLMFLAGLGGAGDDLEEFFRKVSEYDKANYLVVPMGWSYDDKGEKRKAVYWRIPHDESGRLVAAVSWKLMNAMRGDPKALQQIVDFGAGQLPKLAPPITIGANWVAYLSGKNPYDDFRGRPIMPDKVYQAGGRYALTSMVKWTANQMGLASFATHDPSSKSGVESMLEVAPLLNRVIKVSDYGEHEESMKTLTAKQAEDAALSLDRGQAAVSYTKERYILSQKLAADEISTDERTRLSRLNKYYPIYLTYTKAIKRANDKGDQEKVEHYRERLDGILAKVVE